MPAPPESGEVTRLLGALRRGEGVDDAKREDLFRRVYDELHAIARRHRARWTGNDTLNTTGLVHEAYLKLVGGGDYDSRMHFLAVASKAMRHILISYAERQAASKRGGGSPDLELSEAVLVPEARTEELRDLGEALTRLEAVDARAAQIVECRFFGGLDAEETAAALGVSRRTVTRDWSAARAWLYAELKSDTLDAPL